MGFRYVRCVLVVAMGVDTTVRMASVLRLMCLSGAVRVIDDLRLLVLRGFVCRLCLLRLWVGIPWALLR